MELAYMDIALSKSHSREEWLGRMTLGRNSVDGSEDKVDNSEGKYRNNEADNGIEYSIFSVSDLFAVAARGNVA